MKTLNIILVLGLLTISFKPKLNNSSSQSITVVELFTAEGCSSCPAADELLKEMSDIKEKEGYPFIGLSFHVTYWNRSGWIDSFSNEAYTERQKKYQTILKQPLLYTPQAIINGKHEFVGSNPIAFRELLIHAEEERFEYEISATVTYRNDTLVVGYTLNKEPNKMLMNIAIAQRTATRYISRGENKGLKLKHHNVVRSLTSVFAKQHESVIIPWPEKLNRENSTVVLYLQNNKTLKVVGAIKLQ